MFIRRLTKEAEANKLKLTAEFLELEFIRAIANNTKMFFGEKVRASTTCQQDCTRLSEEFFLVRLPGTSLDGEVVRESAA
jgi:hypothetical protein